MFNNFRCFISSLSHESVSAKSYDKKLKIKSFIIFAALRPLSVLRVRGAHLRVIAPTRKKAPFEEILQRWRAVGNTMSDLTGPRFEPLSSCSRNEHVTARQTEQ